jgi:hypothetical protein
MSTSEKTKQILHWMEQNEYVGIGGSYSMRDVAKALDECKGKDDNQEAFLWDHLSFDTTCDVEEEYVRLYLTNNLKKLRKGEKLSIELQKDLVEIVELDFDMKIGRRMHKRLDQNENISNFLLKKIIRTILVECYDLHLLYDRFFKSIAKYNDDQEAFWKYLEKIGEELQTELKTKILEFLKTSPSTLREMVSQFEPTRITELNEMLDCLMDEGKIQKEENGKWKYIG